MMNFYLALPMPLIFGMETYKPANHDYTYQICSGNHNGKAGNIHYKDHAGNHTCWCSSANKGRCLLHRQVNAAIMKAADKAGFICSPEPDTEGLLGGSVDPGRLGSIFPKVPNKESRARHSQLSHDIEEISSASVSVSKKNAMAKAAMDKGAPPIKLDAACMLRADAFLEPKDGNGGTILIDASITHITAKSALQSSLKYFTNELQTEREDYKNNMPTPLLQKLTNSPQVVATAKKKDDKYALIERLMNLRVAIGNSGMRRVKFIPAIMSHRGELGGGLIDLIETCSARFKARERRQENIDGYTPAQATAAYRSNFKSSLLVALAKGWGAQLLSTGTYIRTKKKKQQKNAVDLSTVI
jgi:hypothetical protein